MWFISKTPIQLLELSLNLLIPTSASLFAQLKKWLQKNFSPRILPFNKNVYSSNFFFFVIFFEIIFHGRKQLSNKSIDFGMNGCQNFFSLVTRLLYYAYELDNKDTSTNKKAKKEKPEQIIIITIRIFGNIILIYVCIIERHKGERKNT